MKKPVPLPHGDPQNGEGVAWQSVLNAVPEAILVHDPASGRIVEVNDRLLALFGCSREEARLARLTEFCAEGQTADGSGIQARIARVMSTGSEVFEWSARRRNGELLWCEASLRPARLGGMDLVVVSLRDISRRKRTEAAMQQDEAFAQNVLDSLAAHVAVLDGQGVIVAVNAAWRRFAQENGGGDGVHEGANYLEVCRMAANLHGDPSAAAALEGIGAVLNQERESFSCEYVCPVCRREVWFLMRVKALQGSQGGAVITHEDISQRKQVEARLKEDGLFLKATQDIARVGGWKANPHTDYLVWTEGVHELLGVPPDFKPGLTEGMKFFLPPYVPMLRAKVANCLASGEPFSAECELNTAAGNRLWVEVRGLAQLGAGDQAYVVGTMQDITMRTRAEQALREAHQRERFHFLQTPLGVIAWNLDFRVTEWNPAAERIFGYSAGEAMGQHGSFVVPEAMRAHVDQVWSALLTGHGGRRSTNENLRRDGRHILCEWYNTPLVDESGRVIGVASLVLDVTDQQQAEKQLRDSEQLYHSLVESLPQSIYRKDLAGRFTFANQRFCQSVGKPLQTILGLTAADLQPADLAAKSQANDQLVVASGRTLDQIEEYPAASGQRRVVRVVRTPLRDAAGTVIGVQGIHWDITEQKGAEEALVEREERYRSLFALSPTGILLEDTQGTILEVNTALCRIFGYSQEELCGANIRMLVPPEQQGEVQQHIAELLAGRTLVHEVDNVGKDGKIRRVELREMVVPLPDGQKGILAVVNDITDRRRAEEALRQSQADLERAYAVGHIGGWILELGRSDRLIWSDETCRIFGLAPSEFDGRRATFFGMVYPEDVPKLEAARDAALTTDAPYDMEHRIVRRDRVVRWVHEQAEIERDNVGHPCRMVGVVQDVTERRHLEEQLRHLQRMESVGQLAAGVAHDFNNILTVINGNSALLMDAIGDQPTWQECLQQIVAAGDRAANLTRQLLLFSRKQQLQSKPINLNELTSNLTKMLGRVLGEHITLEFSYANDLPTVRGDPGMLEQVILNLAVNARDAMPGGGCLHISTTSVEFPPDQPALNAEAKPGRFVRLAVRDTGCGIPPEIRDRIFEPFFTTKEVGKGTGLGLATVYGIIKQHEGWIEVKSTTGAGTTFLIYLPTLAAPPSEQKRASLHPPAPGGGQTILVVEDEPTVALLVCQVLARCGYQILRAASGAEVLRLPPEQLDPVDLLLTDLVMPGGYNGRELAAALRKRHPRLRVLYCSGYSPDIAGGWVPQEEKALFLQKPFSPNQVLDAVSACLQL